MVDITKSTKKPLLISSKIINNIKDSILGKKYSLSLVLIGNKKATTLNKKYRKKDYSPNILSFPIDKESGEIFINLDCLEREGKERNLNPKEYLAFLFIHGCLHLKGITHGAKMINLENKFFNKFKSGFYSKKVN